jgi:hypothetical protein
LATPEKEQSVEERAERALLRMNMIANYVQNDQAVWSEDPDAVETEQEDYHREVLGVTGVNGMRSMHAWCDSLRRAKDPIKFLQRVTQSQPGDNWTDKDIIQGAVHHYLDTLSYPDRVALLHTSLLSNPWIKTYFQERAVVSTPAATIYELYNGIEAKNIYHRHIKSSGSWEFVEKGDLNLETYLKDESYFRDKIKNTPPLFGFMWRTRNDDGWTFKLKEKRGPGEKNPAKDGFECRTGIQKLLTKTEIPLLQAVATMTGRLSEICVMTELALRFLNGPETTFFMTSELFSMLYGNI